MPTNQKKMIKIYISITVGCLLLTSSYAQIVLNKKLEEYMDAQFSVNNFSGTVLVTRNDTVLIKKPYGFADLEWNIDNTIDTKFSLASVSKQFTAVAILQLEEKGLLSIDDKLTKYYPEFPEGDKINIHMLLTHNSGIGNDVDELFSSNTFFQSDSIVRYIMSKPLLFEPGTQTYYSNTAYYILTTIIEKASRQTFADYLNENLFEKAKMTNSGISSNESIIPKMAKSYYHKEGELIKNPYINWEYNIGLDGVYSTIDDLYQWNKHLFDDTLLLSEESKSKMFTSHNDHDFGYGVLVNPFYNHGRDLIGHDGGWFGTQTSLNRFTNDNVFVVVLSNNESPSYLLTYGLAAIAFGIPVELPYHHVEVAVDPTIYDQYVGEYEGVRIHQKKGKLFYSDYDIELIPESETKFFRIDNNNRTIEFVQNQKGETIHIIITKAGVREVKTKDN